MPGADILDQRDPMGKPLTGSLLFHGALLAFVLVSPHLLPKTILLGSPTHNSGTIGVSVVKSIPIPQRAGAINRVANDTQSTVPQKPEPKAAPKPVVREKIPQPNAIRIPSRFKEKPKKIDRAASSNPFRPDEPYKKNQI